MSCPVAFSDFDKLILTQADLHLSILLKFLGRIETLKKRRAVELLHVADLQLQGASSATARGCSNLQLPTSFPASRRHSRYELPNANSKEGLQLVTIFLVFACRFLTIMVSVA